MAGEAQQLSFMQGEISPEFYYRSDLATFNSSLSKAVNVKLGPLGGLSNRKGSKVEMTNASSLGFTHTLRASNDYVSCAFQHYITKEILKLEVFNDNGVVTIFCAGTELDKVVHGQMTTPAALDIAGDILNGLKGLHFVIHNDLVIFSKTLPVRYKNSDIVGYTQYTMPIDASYSYTETQFCIRMITPITGGGASLPQIAGIRLESNLTLQNGANLAVPYSTVVQSTHTGTIAGNASYALVGETSEGNDVSLYILQTLPGVNLTITSPAGTISDIIPYPLNGAVTNYLNFSSVSSKLLSYGGKEITKLKLYRTTGKHVAYNSLYKLVSKFGVDGAAAISVNDNGQEEPAYTVCSDTSALYLQPSFHTLCNTPTIGTLTGGLKTVVDTAVFQQRAYYAMNKGLWWGTSVYNNTIVASRVGAVGQVIYPQISNPAEAFQFNVPEERGGFLTHLASMSRLVAFTNTSTFIIQGDDAGIITPTSINPFKVLSFGCMEGVPPVVSGDTCLFASTGGGVGYLSLASDGGAIGGNASALAGHMFENKTILSIVPIEDRKSLPRFLINTTAGDLYECYKVGDTFAFFRVEMLGIPTNGKIADGDTFPMTVIHSPAYARSSFGAEAYVNYRRLDLNTLDHYVNTVSMPPEPLVSSNYFDFTSQLDYSADVGSYSEYLTDATKGVPAGWRYTSQYGVTDLTDPSKSTSLLTYLEDSTGTWVAGNTIQITGGFIPLRFNDSQFLFPNLYMKFTWLDSDGKVQGAYAELISEGDYLIGGTVVFEYSFKFNTDVPVDLRSMPVYFNHPKYGSVDGNISKGIAIAEIAFDKVIIGDQVVSTSLAYYNAKGFCEMMGYDVKGLGTIASPIEIPIALEVNGNVYGNFKDPENTYPVIIKHYYAQPLGKTLTNYFEVELPEICSWFSMGAPAIGEIETLPVASIQQDITDANKNIDYVSVIMYNTKGIRVGEVGQPDTELERFDFTTDDSVTESVYFSGPKSYNFASTWNDHGMIRVSGMDLQPFSISGIIPKGNVGGF